MKPRQVGALIGKTLSVEVAYTEKAIDELTSAQTYNHVAVDVWDVIYVSYLSSVRSHLRVSLDVDVYIKAKVYVAFQEGRTELPMENRRISGP